MKLSLILIAFAICLAQGKAFASYDTTRVVGNIVGLNDSIVKLIIPILDTPEIHILKVKNGKFEWEGVVAQPERALLFTQNNYMHFYVDTGNALININGNVDSLDKAIVTGSKSQKEYELYNNLISDAMNKYYALFEDNTYKVGHQDKNAEVIWENERNEALSEIIKKTKKFILDHPSTIANLSLIEDKVKIYEYDIADSLYQILPKHAQQTNAGKRIFKKLIAIHKGDIGQPFIDFIQNDTSGHPIELSSYKGKYVLIDFWASWCGPCREENPNLLKAYNLYKNKNFTVLGVSLDEDLGKWKKAIKDDRMPWQQVSDLKGFGNSLAKIYGISAIPFNFLIDPTGIIIAKNLRDVSLINKLSETLDK